MEPWPSKLSRTCLECSLASSETLGLLMAALWPRATLVTSEGSAIVIVEEWCEVVLGLMGEIEMVK